MRFLKKHPGISCMENIVTKSQLAGWEEAVPDKYAEGIIMDAVTFLQELGYKITREDVVFAENTENTDIAGEYLEGKCYVSAKAIRLGFDEALDTITHEMFHGLSKCSDESRDFESWLIRENLYNMKRLHTLLKERA